MQRPLSALALLFICTATLPAYAAGDVTFLVGPGKESAAFAKAQTLADGGAVRAESSLHKALGAAAETLVSCGGCTVTIKLAAGAYTGRGGGAQWSVPEIIAPKSTLRIAGGYNEDFSARDPFVNQTVLAPDGPRSAPIIAFEGKKQALKALEISGLVADAGGGNRYSDGNLRKDSSPNWPLFSFGYLSTDRLVISDSVLMNTVNGAAAPTIRAASANAEVVIRNNIILNNIHAWTVTAASGKEIPARYVIEGNSFILNWPYNPDATTSNPGALEIGNKYAAKKVVIKDNLFAWNVGGAVFPQYDEKGGPAMEVTHNLFYGNGGLFSPKNAADGAFVGKFTGTGVHKTFDMDVIAEDFNWKADGNASVDPKLGIPAMTLKAVKYSAADKAEVKIGEDARAPEAASRSASAETQEFAVDTSQLPPGSTDTPAPAMETAAAAPPESLTPAEELDDYAVDGKISGFAPRFAREKAILLPANPEAVAYGANPARFTVY